MMNFRVGYYIFCLILLFQGFTCLGQTISGVVVDKETLRPLSYASLGVKGKSIGGIADRTGQFNINISKANKDDSIIISNIGYEPIALLVKDLSLNKTNEIKLQPKVKELEEVVIVAKHNSFVLGNSKYSSEFTGWGDYISSRGRSRGLQIESKDFPIKITEFNVRLKDNDFDSVKFRLHIYNHNPSVDNDDELLPENVFFTALKNQHWVKVDLEKYNIVITSPLWVTVEWVDAWTSPKSDKGNYLLTFSTGKKEGYSCYRDTPQEVYVINFYKTSPTMFMKGYKVKTD